MGLFEYHNRYLAQRLDVRNLRLLLWLRKIRNPIIVLLFLTLCQAFSSFGLRQPQWSYLPLDSQVENIFSDQDGSIFLVVRGGMFKYSNKLQLLSSSASTSSKVISNETSRNHPVNKILTVIRKGGHELLLSCWQSKDHSLQCLLSKANELQSSLRLEWLGENKGFKANPTDTIRVVVDEKDNFDLLIVTSRVNPIDESSLVPYLPAIGRFRITKKPKLFNLEQQSVLPHRVRSNDFIFLHDYIYSFSHNNYTHFVLNDMHKPLPGAPATMSSESNHQIIRLARICKNDTELTSYTEILLTCNNQNDVYAKSAYFDSSEDDRTLYVMFELRDDQSPVVKRHKSSLCSYSMKLIDDLFYKAISDCYNGYQASNLLAKFYPDSSQAPLCQKNPINDWCSSKTNPYIDGASYRYNVREDTYISLNDISSINFFYVTRQGADYNKVLYIGTEFGYLTKMTLGTDEDLLYTVNLNENRIKDYELNEKFNSKTSFNDTDEFRGTKYTVSSGNIIAATRRGVLNRLELEACYYYTNCKACTSSRDPLECVWCDGSCSKRQDCDPKWTRQSSLSCPPVVEDFHPRLGPLTGNTRIRIEGENFGSKKGKLSVKLGENDCLIDREKSSSQIIECLSQPSNNSYNASMLIEVSDESEPVYIKGTATPSEPFMYVKSKIFGLSPSFGTMDGGDVISIYGENLDAGSSRSVILGDSECRVLNFLSNKLTCVTSSTKISGGNTSYSQEFKQLRVLIDGYEQFLDPRPSLGEYNLSTSYIYKNITSSPEPSKDNAITIDGFQDDETVTHTLLIIVVASMVIPTICICMLCRDKIPFIKAKIQAYESNGDKAGDTKVTFRNPQSHKFLNQDGGSINGLVKLNGSVVSSDYFGKQDQLEQQNQPLMNTFLDSEMMSLLLQEKILIDRSRLTLGHVLGSGQFGRVYKGFLKVEDGGEHAAVAVKTLHNRSTWDDALDNRAFLEEGLMMRDFDHENVLALIGVTFDSSGLPMVITPFMLYGDLRSYISDEASSPTVKELIDFGIQVARGMAYLSGLKFVHRDLAARNCMLDENLTVKVADFGLSRDIYERDYYSSDNKKTKLPVKWMAIESLEKCIYNTKTDVWSYGILLWELMTRGVVPYPDVDNFDIFSYLKEGRRMLRPRYCPLILYKIMLSCWDENPANRPTFDELVPKVSDVITQLKIAKDGQQKVSRDMTYCDAIR